MDENKMGLWERFRKWAYLAPQKRGEHPTLDDYLLAQHRERSRRTRLNRRKLKARARNKMQKLSRRINWGLV